MGFSEKLSLRRCVCVCAHVSALVFAVHTLSFMSKSTSGLEIAKTSLCMSHFGMN